MKRKRFIALILAIVMTIGMFPVYTSAEEGASAAPTVPGETVPVTTAASESVPATTAAPSVVQETTPVTTTAPATTEPATEPAAVPTIVPEETNAPVDNCPYCEDSTAEDGTVIHGANCNAAYVYDGTADVGRYVQLIPAVAEAGVVVSGDPASDPDGISFFYDEFGADTVMRITEWYWDAGTTGLWYRVELHSGAFPESTADYSWPGTPWILQDYTDTTYEWDAVLEFVTVEEEPEETEPEATTPTERIQCGICGSYDCTALHFYCDICEAYDCGKPHLYCNLCEAYDCTAEHIWCGSCGSHDCGLEHEDLHTPVTAPVIPEAPTMPEGEEVSIVDAQGNPVEGLLLRQGEKTSLSAWSGLETASYQWQVRYDGNRDLWTDIHGQTGKGILISPAMFLSILDAQGTAAIRCVVSAGGEKKISEAISVAMAEQSVVLRASAPAYGAQDTDSGVMPLAGDTDNKVNLIINYKFTNGTIAANPWAATLPAGEPYSTGSTPITIPTIAGYTPVVDGAAGGAATLDGYQLRLDLPKEQLTQDLTLNIVYQASEVAVTVLHYWQNVNDDNYTLRETEHLSLVTENQVSDVHKSYEGFYNLLYERPFVAADGSTVVEVYYDRYYYLMKFDLGGGYGVDPIYARYGTELEVPDPTKAGYSFAGWTDKDKNGVALPNAMPVNGGTYYADWNAQNAQYTVAYWLLDANNKKSLIGTHIELGTSGAKVSGEDDLGAPTDRGAICGELDHTHTAGCFSCGKEEHVHHQQHSVECYAGTLSKNGGITDEKDTAAINAANNGSTPENGTLYFIQSNNDITSGRYWPKMYIDGSYYTVTVNGNSSINKEVLDTIVDGALINTGNDEYTATKYKAKLICEKTPCGDQCAIEEHTHSANCTACKLHIHTAACYQNTRHMEYVQSDAGVEIKGDGSAIVNVYYRHKEYTLKFYYAASTGTGNNITYKIVGGSTYFFGRQKGVGGTADGPQLANVPSSEWGQVDELPTLNATGLSRNYTEGSLEYSDVTYYFISFKARYGDDISDMWPCAVFNSVTRTSPNNTNGWSGTEAFVSAWNGEHHVKYSQDNNNETIKGVYEKLDENLLFASEFDDEQEVSYLCFWENGANINWSIPELYIYNIWLPCVGNQESTAPEGAVKKFEDNIWYYRASTYNTVDDSDIANQTNPALEGYSFRIKKWKPHFIADTQLSQDETYYYGIKNGNTENKYDINQKIVWSGSWEYPGEMKVSTKDQGSDRYLLHSPDYDPDNPGEVINHALYKEAYTVDFYYTAQTYRLSFWNHDGYLVEGGTGSQVAYREPLLKYFEGINVNGNEYEGANDLIAKAEYYPDTLEPGAYQFDGWYTSAQFLDGTKVDPATMTMPSEPLMVYAKWVPVTRRVRFFLSEASMTAGKTIPEEMKELWKEEYDTEPYPQNSPYDTKFATLTAVTNNTYLPDLSDPGVTDSGDAYFQKIHPYAGYDFMGWFYVNEAGEEAAFDPENMPVTRDLDLYAKWGSNMLCPYEIYFALDDNKDGTADTGTDGKPIYVADPITGSALAGNSRTFDAKGDTALYAAYQNGYFPNVPSHTIMLQIRDEDGEPGQDLTTFTFLYRPELAVPYTVKYLETGTNKALVEHKTEGDNTKAVVTENFEPIPGYVPDAYQKTLVVVPGETTNEIIFYYTQDTQHALYQVNHYIQNLDGETWSEYSTSTITGNIGTDYSASAISITGYDFSDQHTNQYNLTEKKNPYTGVDLPGEVNFAEDTDTVSGKLTGYGMQLNLYYTRQVYTYTVRYLEYGTDQVLHDEKTGEAKYNQLVSENAVEIQIDLDGDGKIEDFRLYEATQDPQTATIRDNSTVLTFYYVRCTQTMTITKRVVHNVVDSDQEFEFSLKIHAGGYHRNSYTYKKTGGDTGILYPEASEPTLLRFTLKAGETITIEGLPTAEYTVQEENVPPCYDVSYFPDEKNTLTVNSVLDVTVTNTYATTLTITKKVDSVLEEQQSFIFTVRRAEKDLNMRVIITIPAGEDSGSVTLAEIPMGQYTIEEEESWSWRYGDKSKIITLGDERSYNVEITNTRTNPYWLSGADANKNIFDGTP